jgi:hypothetical protein
MTVLTRRESLGQIKDIARPSVTAAASFGPRGSLLRQGNPRGPEEVDRCHRIWGVRLKKFEAEGLIDWLQANGRSGRLNYVPGEGFTVGIAAQS